MDVKYIYLSPFYHGPCLINIVNCSSAHMTQATTLLLFWAYILKKWFDNHELTYKFR